MAKIVFNEAVSADKLKEILQGEFGTTHTFNTKGNRLDIVQDGIRGCSVLLKIKDGKTVCMGPYGFIPSSGPRVALILGFWAVLFIIGLSTGYLFLGFGFLPFIILILLMKLPSRELVVKVRNTMERLNKTKA